MPKKKIKSSPDLSYINPKLHVLAVPIDSLTPDTDNARTHDERNLETTRKSLQQFGQQKPIVIDASRVVRAGNGTMLAAQALGWTHLAAVESNLSGAALDAYEIADNRSAEQAGWNPGILYRQLNEISAAGIPSLDIGFLDDEIEKIHQSIPADLSEPEQKPEQPQRNAPPSDQYKIVIECRDEMQQTELLDRFDQEGLKCKALVG